MFASVDIGASTTCCGVATGTGEMLAERIIPTMSHEGSGCRRWPGLRDTKELAASTGHRLAAVGVRVPGLSDFHRGRTVFLLNMPTGWRDYPVADRLSASVGCPW